MKAIHWIIAAAALTSVQAAPASAGVNDPEVIIYRFPWVRDSGDGAGLGWATVFSCTNFSGAQETIRFVIRRSDTTILANTTQPLFHLETRAVATHAPAGIPLNVTFNTGLADPGTAAIAATSTNIICTATVVNAASSTVNGVALRGVRFNPAPGSQE